jgi:hypothetical protein
MIFPGFSAVFGETGLKSVPKKAFCVPKNQLGRRVFPNLKTAFRYCHAKTGKPCRIPGGTHFAAHTGNGNVEYPRGIRCYHRDQWDHWDRVLGRTKKLSRWSLCPPPRPPGRPTESTPSPCPSGPSGPDGPDGASDFGGGALSSSVSKRGCTCAMLLL